MALVPSFIAEQIYDTPKILKVTDTSTGSDGSFVFRKLYIKNSSGETLGLDGVNDYIYWDATELEIDVEILNKDYALEIKVVWCDDAGGELYDPVTILKDFTYYGESFYYSLALSLSNYPTLANSPNFMSNRSALRTLLDSSSEAIIEMQDILSSQQSLDNATFLINNPNVFN